MMRKIPIIRVLSVPLNRQRHECSRALRPFSSFEKRLGVTTNLLKYQKSENADRIKLLADPSAIPANMVYESLSYLPGSLTLAMTLRGHILSLLHNKDVNVKRKVETSANNKKIIDSPSDTSHDYLAGRKHLVEMDIEIKKWLLAAFSPDMLSIQEISLDKSSANTLQKIANGDAVGAVQTSEELKYRLRNSSRYENLQTNLCDAMTALSAV